MNEQCEVGTSAENGRRSEGSYEIICTLCTGIMYSIYNVNMNSIYILNFMLYSRESRANEVFEVQIKGARGQKVQTWGGRTYENYR